MTSALDATRFRWFRGRVVFLKCGLREKARHPTQGARRVFQARLVGRLEAPPRSVQWKLLVAAEASLEIDCQPARCELFAGCARERPGLD